MRHWLLIPLLSLVVALPAATAQEAAGGGGEDVAREICSACHDEADAFAEGPHGRAMLALGEDVLERSCNACHGPADQHVEDPTAENIHRIPSPDACRNCHVDSGSRLALAAAAHQRHDVACLDCHASGHEDPGTDYLLADQPVPLCTSCHGAVAAAFERPFAHRDGSRDFSCLNCHSLHGWERAGRLASWGNGGACVECHTAQAGPFVFPHPPREVGNGCVACHEPHGSTNPRLLTRRLIFNQCLECHTGVPAFHDLSQARFRACQSCHVAVHGSNRDPRLFDE
jgi:DmsE family decaheme c-type cytochrome